MPTLTVDQYNQWGATLAAQQSLYDAVGGASSNLIQNGSFEDPVVDGYTNPYPPTGIPHWTFDTGGGIQRNGSAWQANRAPDGQQTAFVQGSYPNAVAQTLTLPVGEFLLSFYVAQRNYGGLNPLKVTLDGGQIGDHVMPPSLDFSVIVIPFSVSVAGEHVLAFCGVTEGDNSTFLDAVAVTAK